MIPDRLPPFDPAAEDSVCASVLVAPDECLPVVQEILQPGDFYREQKRPLMLETFAGASGAGMGYSRAEYIGKQLMAVLR